jgi:myo-inositol 2-dehydrogenase / D-chiro-inositol 1-dehydrogenase
VESEQSRSSGFSRRAFLRTSAFTAAGVAASRLVVPGYAYADGVDTIKIGLIGCGGRGTGAAKDAVVGSEGVEIVAMGDLMPDRLRSSREQLAKAPELAGKLKVTDATAYTGFDAYQKVLATPGVNLVILATPPAFRPIHLAAAVAAGKHVFMEKPVAVDPTGIRSVIASSDLAASKGLAVVAGTQRRHDPKYIETMRRIHDGAIGEIVGGQVYWNQGGLWRAERTPAMSDMEWQIRNWLYFTWSSGDHIVEQHVHNIDVANWAMNGHPVKANGVGGRQVRTDPGYGQIFDHFAVELEYPNGTKILSMCKQQDGTSTFIGENFVGTKGRSDGAGTIRAAEAWRYRSDTAVNPYEQEHTDLVASIRAGKPLNEGRRIAESVLTAIMAREAAYTGQEITWEQISASDLDLVPKTFAFGPLPVAPVPMPGVTKLSRPPFAHAHTTTTQAGR